MVFASSVGKAFGYWLNQFCMFESNPEQNVLKKHIFMRVQIAQTGVVPNVGYNKPSDVRESR